MRALSLLGVVSPNPTVEKTVTVQHNASVWDSASLKACGSPAGCDAAAPPHADGDGETDQRGLR